MQILCNTVITVTTFVHRPIISHTWQQYGESIAFFDRHTNVEVQYIEIKTITVWSISSIFIRITYFPFFNIQFRTIQGDCWLYSYNSSIGKYDIVKILLLLLDSYHWFLVLLIILFSCFNFLQHTIHKTVSSHYSVVPGVSFWTAGWFKGSVNCCLWVWFIVGNRPVFLGLIFIWYVSHPEF